MSNPNKSLLTIHVKNQPINVVLSTQSSIIYLIGKNGAGKSRLIDGIKNGQASISILSNQGQKNIRLLEIKIPNTAFERTSKRRRGFPSETNVKRGVRVVSEDKYLTEKLGRNDPCPCESGLSF